MRGCGETTKIIITHIDANHPFSVQSTCLRPAPVTGDPQRTGHMQWPHALYGHTQGAGHTGRGVQSVGLPAQIYLACLAPSFTQVHSVHTHARTHAHSHAHSHARTTCTTCTTCTTRTFAPESRSEKKECMLFCVGPLFGGVAMVCC